MKNRTFICIQCGTEFGFTINEQRRYEKMGFDDPRRCPVCRKKKTKQTDDQNGPKSVDWRVHRHHKNTYAEE